MGKTPLNPPLPPPSLPPPLPRLPPSPPPPPPSPPLPPPPPLHGLQMDRGFPLPPPHPTLHDLQMDKVAGQPSRLGGGFQMDKGATPICKRTRVGAQPFTTPPQPCTTCRWTRVGGPNPSRLANGRGLGPPNPSRLANLKFCLDKHWGLQTIERLSIFHRGPGASPQIETSMTRPSSQNAR